MKLIRFSWFFALGLVAAAPSTAQNPNQSGPPPVEPTGVAPGCGYTPLPEWYRSARDRARAHGIPLPFDPKDGEELGGSTVFIPEGVLLTLGPDDLFPDNLFDLEGRTLRFVPVSEGYQVTSLPIQWDSDFGTTISGFPSVEITLNNFQFPFSESQWDSLFINYFGNITFGAGQDAFYDRARDRFLKFRNYGGTMINTLPIISPLFHKLGGAFGFEIDPDDVNQIFVREAADRIVVTWSISEPYREIQSFIEDPEINLFQAALYDDGTIDMSYQDIQVRDGIVGIFPLGGNGGSQPLAQINDGTNNGLPAHIDVLSVDLDLVDGQFIQVSFNMRGDILPEGDPLIDALYYRAYVDLEPPFPTGVDFDDAEFSWFVRGNADLEYSTGGPGTSPFIEIAGKTIRLSAHLSSLNGQNPVAIFIDTVDFNDPEFPFDQTAAVEILLPDLEPTADLSESQGSEAPRDVIFEAFHYPDIPGVTDLGCEVIGELGDLFDMLVMYTDFRIDDQEAGAVSTGAIGDSVSGLRRPPSSSDLFCSDGQLQVIQHPSYIGSPFGAASGFDYFGAWEDFNRQVALMSHEIGHRWLSLSTAIVGGEEVQVGTFHWFPGFQSSAPFPVAAEYEASPMGGGHWLDNGDDTFSQLANAFYAPATAYSSMDLYMMGLLPESDVGVLFVLDELQFLFWDQGIPIYSADRIDVTIDDMAAFHGPRLPPFEESQRNFVLGAVGIVQDGQQPSQMLLDRLDGLAVAFRQYFSAATGDVGTVQLLNPGSSKLTIVKGGDGTGIVTSDPAGISCDDGCSQAEARFTNGTPVALASIAGPGSFFVGWSGDPPCLDGVLTVDADITCMATFCADSDGDGICNTVDICQGADDRDDADGDEVPDGCDHCPGFDDNFDTDTDGIPDGCDVCSGAGLVLADQVVISTVVYEACTTITAGDGFHVLMPGNVTFRAGTGVALESGFGVGPGARFVIDLSQ